MEMFTHLQETPATANSIIASGLAKSIKDELYKLRINDDSMIDAGIEQYDLLEVKASDHFRDGDIVVALVEDQIKIRQYFEVENKIYLVPANVAYSPIEIGYKDTPNEIIGVVVRIDRNS